MQDIIANLVNPLKKIVFVWGWPGIGKSTILRDLSTFFAQRDFFKQGVLYLNITQVENFSDFLTFFLEKLQEMLNPDTFQRSLSKGDFTIKQHKNSIEQQLKAF